MDFERLQQAVQTFAAMWHESEEVKNHIAEHRRRMQRAQTLLRPERLSQLTEEELRALFLDTDAFSFWQNPEGEFQRRLAKTSLADFREALRTLTQRAEAGLNPEDLATVLRVHGLGMLLITELLCYRFPNRYWTFSPNVTNKALHLLGVDTNQLKRSLPRGQRNDAHLYFALKPVMDEVVAALREAGIPEADFNTADIFLWHLLEDIRPDRLTIQDLIQLLQHDQPTPETREQAFRFLERVQEWLEERLGSITSRIGPQKPSAGSRHFAQLTIPVIPNLIPGKKNRRAKRDLNLEVYVLPGRLWWGVYVWTFQEMAQRLQDIFADLGLVREGERAQVGKGALELPDTIWAGGSYFALGKGLTPEEVGEFASVDALASHLAEEIAAYFNRITPLAEAIRQGVEEAFPSTPIDPERDQVAQLLTALFPDEAQRRKALELFCEAILVAHREHPGNWSISLSEPKKVRLNVGRVVVMTMEANTVWLVVEESLLPDDLRDRVQPYLTPEYRYKTLPTGIGLSLTPEQAWDWREGLWPAFVAFVAQAARSTAQLPAPLRRAHAPVFLRYLEQALGKPVPEPDYLAMDLALAPGQQVWLFQANPQRYDLEQGLRRHRLNDWQVTRFKQEIRPGDLVLLWKAGENRGLYGVGRVASERYRRPDGDEVVDVEYLGRLREPLLAETLQQHPVLSQMHILRAPQGTNFRVTEKEWEALRPMITDLVPPDPDAIDARQMASPSSPSLRGPALAQALRQVFRRQGLQFTPWQIATFYTALQTKGFVILSGISGTGKTKLARQFAAALPQPQHIEDETTIDLVAVTVQPYMRKYGRLIIPKRATKFFTPPAPGEAQEIAVHFGAQRETCRFVHAAYGDSDYLSLLLRGEARRWFTATLQPEDTLYLDFETDAEGNLRGLRLLPEAELQRQKPPRQGRNWLFVPVRPDWRDGKSLLGYYNPLTNTYHWTPFLRFVLQAVHSYRRRDGLAWFVILDEMNLARVEYYFGDLLSILESGRDEEGWSREPLRFTYPDDAEGDRPPREIFLPPNLYILGTINVDETTHTLSPKVLDRAFTLELNEADLEAYLTHWEAEGEGADFAPRAVLDNFTFGGRFVHLDKRAIAAFVAAHPEIRAQLHRLNQALQPYDLHFGYRVFDEIIAFLLAAEHNGLYEELGGLPAALDAAVLMKVLPKFHGGRSKLEAPLRAVLAWCVDPDQPATQRVVAALDDALRGNEDLGTALSQALADLAPRMPQTAAKVRRMLGHLYTTGFAAF